MVPQIGVNACIKYASKQQNPSLLSQEQTQIPINTQKMKSSFFFSYDQTNIDADSCKIQIVPKSGNRLKI